MKIFLTEIDDPFNDKKYVGPYIKALSIEEAQKIVDENKQVNNIGKPESIQSAFNRIRQ